MKYRGDDEGFKRGALGKHDPGVKLNRNNPWGDGDPATSPKGVGKYTSDNSGLRQKQPRYDGMPDSRDIMDNVEKNQLGGKTGPVKFGVD